MVSDSIINKIEVVISKYPIFSCEKKLASVPMNIPPIEYKNEPTVLISEKTCP